MPTSPFRYTAPNADGDGKAAGPTLNEEELQSKNGSDNAAAEAVPEHELQSMDTGSGNDEADAALEDALQSMDASETGDASEPAEPDLFDSVKSSPGTSGSRVGKLPMERKDNRDDELEERMQLDMQLAMHLSKQATTGNDGAGSSRSHLPFMIQGNIEISKASVMNVQVIFGDQVHNLNVQWGQQYVTFVNEVIKTFAKSTCALSRQHAALPYPDFRNTIRWQECQHIPRSKDSLSMREVIQPISDDDEDKFKEHRVFKVDIEQFHDTHPGVTDLFGSEDIVTTMLENMHPWYDPRNLGVLIAFSATCWGALKVVRLLIGGAPTPEISHLPSPWFFNGRPSVIELHHQWQPSMDKWLLPWRQIKRDYDNLALRIEHETLRVEVMDRLHSSRWMHQDIINAFMTLLSSREDQCPHVTFFAHCQFYAALIAHGWQHVKKWMKPWRKSGKKAAKFRVFYFPINVGNYHWIGAKVVLHKLEDNSLQMDLFGMDSMSTSLRDEYQRLYTELHAAFTSEWVEFGENSFLEGPLQPASAGNHVHVLTRLTTPAQLGGIDCGLFVMRWIECDSLGLPCDYSQLEMVHFRRLTFIELSYGQIIRRVVPPSLIFEREYPRAFWFKNQVLTSALARRATILNRAIHVAKPPASESSRNPGGARAHHGTKRGIGRGGDGRGRGAPGRGRSRGGARRGHEGASSAEENQAAFNAVLEPLLTSSLPCGVITLRVRESDASACAAALSAWKDGSFKVYDTMGKKVLDLGGYNTYPKTLEPYNKEEQRLHTLLVTSAQLPQVRDHLPGFKAMELELVTWLQQHFGTEVELFEAHGLRQGPSTMRSTGFAVHQDNEVHKFVEYTVVVKLTADIEGEAPSAMHVVGSKLDFVYDSMAGASACFRAGLHHASVAPMSPCEHLKMTFFFRHKVVKAKYMQDLQALYTEASFEELGADEKGGLPYTIIGTWTSASVNARVRPFNDWLKPDELASTPLGAIVYFVEIEAKMIPFHVAMESELLRVKGLHGEWGLYPCVQHERKDGPTFLGQMKGALVKGGPFRRGSEELLSKLTKSSSIYLWECKVDEDSTGNRKRKKKLEGQTVELMDASSMHRGSVKCINDARGLTLPSGESAKNNVKLEPDGVISINKGVKLDALTTVDRKQRLSEMEFLMDYGNAYFVGASPSATSVAAPVGQSAKSGSRRRKFVAQRTVDVVQIDESDPEERALHVSRMAPVSSSEDDDFEKMRKELKHHQPIGQPSRDDRGDRYQERLKRAMNAEAELPKSTFKARSVVLPMLIPLEDRPELVLNLENEKALKIFPIADDSNCVFRVLAHLVFEGDDEAHADVRDAVCNELEADPEGVYSQRFTPRIGDYREDTSYAAHVTRMRRLKEWGGEAELRAAASIFGFKIHVHHPFYHTGVQVIEAPLEKKGTVEVDVHMVYYGDHYDVAYHESRPFNPESSKRMNIEAAENVNSTDGLGVEKEEIAAPALAEEAVAPVDDAINDGDGNARAYCRRGESLTGKRLSSIRLPGQGLSRSSR